MPIGDSGHVVPNVSRGFSWESDAIRIREFRIAAHYLAAALPGTVLPTRYPFTDPDFPAQKVELTRRFLKSDVGNVYAIASGKKVGEEGVLGQGGFGLVRLGQSVDGALFAIKEYRRDEYTLMEEGVALDLKLAKEAIYLSTRNMLICHYFGVSLKTYLHNNRGSLDEKHRLELAVKTFAELYRLHTGQSSVSGKKYFHGDVKLENFVIGEDGTVRLIDFGMSKSYAIDGPVQHNCGTFRYLIPRTEVFVPHFRRENFDVFAWGRSICLPRYYWRFKKVNSRLSYEIYKVARHPQEALTVFTDAMVSKNPIFSRLFDNFSLSGSGDRDIKIPTLEEIHMRLTRIVGDELGEDSPCYYLLASIKRESVLSNPNPESVDAVDHTESVSSAKRVSRHNYSLRDDSRNNSSDNFLSPLAGIASAENARLSNKACEFLKRHELATESNMHIVSKNVIKFFTCIEKLTDFFIQTENAAMFFLNAATIQCVIDNIEAIHCCLTYLNLQDQASHACLARVLTFPGIYHAVFSTFSANRFTFRREFELYEKCVSTLENLNLVTEDRLKQLICSGDKKVGQTAIVLLTKGIAAAKNATKDNYKKKACDIFLENCLNPHFINYLRQNFFDLARILSHPTNCFRSRSSSGSNTAAFEAARFYFEEARFLLDVSDHEWNTVIFGKPDKANSIITCTYSLFKRDMKALSSKSSNENAHEGRSPQLGVD